MAQKYCQQCGESNLDNARFCGRCGTAFPVPTQSFTQNASPHRPTSFLDSLPIPLKWRKYRLPAIIAGVILLILIFIFVIFPSKPAAPSHYGVFIRQNGHLNELTQEVYFNIPTISQMVNPIITKDRQPTIVVWLKDVRTEYLELRTISAKMNSSTKLKVTITPLDNGVLEIKPVASLAVGAYCLFQGNPLGVGTPGWCFTTSPTGITTLLPPTSTPRPAATRAPEPTRVPTITPIKK